MSKKRKIIFLSTLHRTSERVLPAIKSLDKNFDVVIINYGQSSVNVKYPNDANLRYNKYISENFCFDNIYNTSGGITDTSYTTHRKQADEVIHFLEKNICNKTTAIIIDDCRPYLFSKKLYNIAKKNDIVVFSNTHGNGAFLKQKGEKIYDYLFCLGTYDKLKYHNIGFDDNELICSGIPSNDSLKSCVLSNEYILVIVNFIGPHPHRYKFFDYDVLKKMKILELQKRMNKPVLFKLKTRLKTDQKKELNVFKENILKAEISGDIVYEVESEDALIAGASSVLSYGSTMAFKSVQLDIPTVIFKDLGLVGAFEKYSGLISVGEDYDYIFQNDFMKSQRKNFLESTLTGGCDFSSKDFYVESVNRRIIKK